MWDLRVDPRTVWALVGKLIKISKVYGFVYSNVTFKNISMFFHSTNFM